MNIIEDTICAPATAPGGALGIIRISGSRALTVVSNICSLPCKSMAANTVHFTRITEYDAMSQSHTIIDEALVTVFRAPHSYTGEDAAEISCHGSRYILNKVLELLCQHGCRMANPGEFTMRAYLNGKLDLTQAESVADLIASTNKATHDIAMSQLRGGISTELSQLRDQLLKLTSLLELELDFSDHEDLEFADRTELLELTQKIDSRITTLAHSFEAGQAIKHGIPVTIVGKTNVGKSTLLNQLVDEDRAIISSLHGTTRDTIEDEIEIDGILFRFIDTAGIRQTSDEIERIGIERTMKAIEKARIVIWLFDTKPSNEEIREMENLTKGKRRINVLNKADLINEDRFMPYMVPMQLISAKYGTHINSLKRSIIEESRIAGLIANDKDVIISNARHYDALIRAHASIQQIISGIQQQFSGDLLAEDLRQTLDILSEITGNQITPQETLNNIFKSFCVGK